MKYQLYAQPKMNRVMAPTHPHIYLVLSPRASFCWPTDQRGDTQTFKVKGSKACIPTYHNVQGSSSGDDHA
jgi:hypothetical protein